MVALGFKERSIRALRPYQNADGGCGHALEPAEPGEVYTPLNIAPHPSSPARQLFTDGIITTHLDALVAAQEADGGWPINWQAWTEASGLEWRGWATIEALKTLRTYSRLS